MMNLLLVLLLLVVVLSLEGHGIRIKSNIRQEVLAGLKNDENTDSRLLSKVPMLMAHDAATTYLHQQVLPNQVLNWAITQPGGGFTKMLDCGARAFDVRPEVVANGDLLLHHGTTTIQTKLEVPVNETLTWTKQNPGELVILVFNVFKGTNVRSRTQQLVTSMGVPYLTNCTAVNALTYDSALQLGQVIAVADCVAVNYNPSISCTSTQLSRIENSVNKISSIFDKLKKLFVQEEENVVPESFFAEDCTASNSKRNAPYARFEDYMVKTSSTGDGDKLFMLQAHWQYDGTTIANGLLAQRTLMLENTDSGVNAFTAGKIDAGAYKNINLLELDNVCYNSTAIVAALQKHAAESTTQ